MSVAPANSFLHNGGGAAAAWPLRVSSGCQMTASALCAPSRADRPYRFAAFSFYSFSLRFPGSVPPSLPLRRDDWGWFVAPALTISAVVLMSPIPGRVFTEQGQCLWRSAPSCTSQGDARTRKRKIRRADLSVCARSASVSFFAIARNAS